MADSVKWALIDLIKVLDRIMGGLEHEEFVRIARTLGVELPAPTNENLALEEDEV